MEDPEVRKQFDKALVLFVKKAKQDKKVLALILYGSLAYDEIVEGSNINIYVITEEGKHRWTRLIENNIPIDIAIYSKNDFQRRALGRESVPYNQVLSRSKLLFSRDDSFTDFYNNLNTQIGERDKTSHQIIYFNATTYDIKKAEKYLYIKNNIALSLYYLMHGVSELGYFICYLNGIYPPREVILVGRELEPELYKNVYDKVVNNKVTFETLDFAIRKVYEYLDSKEIAVFKPVLDFITENGGTATQTEIDTHFSSKGISFLDLENLHRRRILRRTFAPLRITRKGIVEYHEPQYHFDWDFFESSKTIPTQIGPSGVDRKIVHRDYQKALDDLVEKVKADEYALSFLLCGSLSHDVVWEKSDLDVIIITRDEPYFLYKGLIEQDVSFDTLVFTRDQFRNRIQRQFDGSLAHSHLSVSKLIYTKDESINDLLKDIKTVGSRDVERQLFLNYTFCRDLIIKAKKALYVKDNPSYSFYFIIAAIRRLANIEVMLNKTIPLREVIQQAIVFNPQLFNTIFTEIINREIKDKHTINAVLQIILDYLDEKMEIIAQPLLSYLEKEQEVTHYDLKTHFNEIRLPIDLTDFVRKGLIIQTETPIRFARKSSIEMTQPAYSLAKKNDDIMMDFIK
ncbi:MAG TPA: hypothetical protein VMX55_06205 [candidate division Zixibacteria bacterium]|nr:hypothetical protein [candidate division Zixibacteria bacterium]